MFEVIYSDATLHCANVVSVWKVYASHQYLCSSLAFYSLSLFTPLSLTALLPPLLLSFHNSSIHINSIYAAPTPINATPSSLLLRHNPYTQFYSSNVHLTYISFFLSFYHFILLSLFFYFLFFYFLYRRQPPDQVIIFSHGNAEDLGLIERYLQELTQVCDVSINFSPPFSSYLS